MKSTARSKQNSRLKTAAAAAIGFITASAAFAGPPAPVEVLTQPPAESFWTQKYLTGDWGGLRTRLEDKGITITGNHIGDFLADVAGNHTHHGTWFGRFRLSLDVNLKKLADIDGEFFATAIYQYGQNLSGKYLNVNTLTSSIAGIPSLRVDEIWYQQGLFDSRLKIKLGQIAAVNEFGATDFFDILMNDELGYAPNALFPPAQPFSPAGKPGAIVTVDLRDLLPGLYLKAGAFAAYLDAYHPDRNGVDYVHDFDRGPAYTAEIGYKESSERYPGVYKVGANFNDLKGYTDLETGEPLRGDFNIYGIVEKTVYRPAIRVPDGKSWREDLDLKKGLDLLVEIIGSPNDRNALEFEATLGARYTGLIRGRDTDQLGLGFIYSQTSRAVSRASEAAGGPNLDGEFTATLDYRFNITPWFAIQPDLQAIFNPRGDSNRNNILVLGVRTIIAF
jgi:porin